MLPSDRAPGRTRREFVGLGLIGLVGHSAASAQAPKDENAGLTAGERKTIAAIRDKAREAALGPFRLHAGDHFLVIGNASDAFQGEVLDFCEKLGKAFLAYFAEKRFAVAYPDDRMAVVILKDRASYGAWIGEPADAAIGGHYDRDTNRLVVFDFRADPGRLGDQARVVNSFTLSHEANHLLAFNTGLLSRTADIPTCIIEGLATVGELFQKTGHSAIGGFNKPRMGALADATRNGEPWIDVRSLLTNDDLFDDAKTNQVAYAESWLLVSMMIKNPEKLAKFRSYLEVLKKQGHDADRARDAEAALGPLDRLNRELKLYQRR